MHLLHMAFQLTYLAVSSNFGSIFTVFICCAAMILFIRQFRLHEFELAVTSVVEVKQLAAEQFLAKVNLPFSLEVGTLDSSGLDSQHLTLYSTSFFPCLFVVCREMSADKLKVLLNEPWQKFIEIFTTEEKLLSNIEIYAKEDIHLSKPFLIQSPISQWPRLTYAFVTFHIRTDVERIGDEEPAAIITIIHIPDRYCNAPATTLCQYLKFKGGRVLNLKPLYSQEKNYSTSEDESSRRFLKEGNDNCIICWNLPPTHVLLPCRHACLCANCFKRVENCPICRSRVLSFFVM
ncbi:hypothetical protein GHT06_005693 [Daphnia sinensis]|uniref:RING-type domain-containing protein n=1 Tax=Daphnia sinensis TaxID=1820382 RepID=A0AAD5KWN0_9CRUS|nr:hypothetical protein GHT06_005563 [Daphnia sinensis]KAI9551030.1 hypothetical protein GHT06_005693 [Daphnia sinensis]